MSCHFLPAVFSNNYTSIIRIYFDIDSLQILSQEPVIKLLFFVQLAGISRSLNKHVKLRNFTESFIMNREHIRSLVLKVKIPCSSKLVEMA
jgi:hypothetical protein